MSFAHERNSGMQGWIACDPPEHTGYDAEGNMTGETDSGGNVWTFGYDYRDRMTGFTEKNSGGTIIAQGTYVYDALDRRIETIESVSGGAATVTWMVFNGFSDTAYAEYSSGGTLEYRYLSGPSYIAGVDALLARTSSGGTTGFYLTDQLGSVTDIVNSSGTVLDHVSYDPFGNILSESSPSSGDTMKYEGLFYDSILDDYVAFHRLLNPLTGRFTSNDPIGFSSGSANLFAYVSNSSTNLVDPTGLAKVEIVYRKIQGLPAYHTFIVITDPSGVQYYIGAYPHNTNPIAPGNLTVTTMPLEDIPQMTGGSPTPGSDYRAYPDAPKQVVEDNDLPIDAYLPQIGNYASKVNKGGVGYSPLGPNSNSVAFELAKLLTGLADILPSHFSPGATVSATKSKPK